MLYDVCWVYISYYFIFHMQIPKILIRCQLHPNKWYRKPRNNLPQNINPLADSDGNTDLSLVEADHVTWILTCHWSRSQYSYPQYHEDCGQFSFQIRLLWSSHSDWERVLTHIGADIIIQAKLSSWWLLKLYIWDVSTMLRK